ncbi:MAG: hypothetical protein QNI84_05345 [Henriciella sp.]|nr:hypothetical protein [Henriciella sp.]
MTSQHAPDQRVLDLIEACGADPLMWPEGEREAAQAAIAQAPDLYASALEDARALDAALKHETAPEPAVALFENILRAAPKPVVAEPSQPWLVRTLFPNGARWPAGAALASLAMGVVGGYAYAATAPASYSDTEQVYLEAFGFETYETWLSQEGSQ